MIAAIGSFVSTKRWLAFSFARRLGGGITHAND
jgi:hypothetical protein